MYQQHVVKSSKIPKLHATMPWSQIYTQPDRDIARRHAQILARVSRSTRIFYKGVAK